MCDIFLAPAVLVGGVCLLCVCVLFSSTVGLFFGCGVVFSLGLDGVLGVFVCDVRTIMFIKTH